jgi:hypothetical protein
VPNRNPSVGSAAQAGFGNNRHVYSGTGNPAGVRHDFEVPEKRRFQAMRLREEGLNQSEVARRVRVARQTVVRWVAQYRERGKEGLRKAGRAGRKARLSVSQRERLEGLLLRGPEALGYQTPLWTCPGGHT